MKTISSLLIRVFTSFFKRKYKMTSQWHY